jgi:hypothetical protein
LIKVLAGFFRGVSFIIGMTAPAPEEDERPFVFLWLAIIGALIVSCAVLFYAISHVHVP